MLALLEYCFVMKSECISFKFIDVNVPDVLIWKDEFH